MKLVHVAALAVAGLALAAFAGVFQPSGANSAPAADISSGGITVAGAGDIVDAAVGAGANQVYGPSLLASDQDAAYRTALKAAVAQARAQAETLATAAGRSLGAITAISEGGSTPVPLPAVGATRD